jgi:hypothetical protein
MASPLRCGGCGYQSCKGIQQGTGQADRNEATLMPIGLYGKCSLEFGVILVNLKAMVAGMSDSLRRYLKVLWLASHQGHAFPTLIGFL